VKQTYKHILSGSSPILDLLDLSLTLSGPETKKLLALCSVNFFETHHLNSSGNRNWLPQEAAKEKEQKHVTFLEV